MGKKRIEINVPDNLDELIESLAKFLHKKPDDILSRIALDAVKALPNSLDKYVDVTTIRKIYNV
jgi:phosphatidylinositol kinase/protein kinase (PI-3  family)